MDVTSPMFALRVRESGQQQYQLASTHILPGDTVAVFPQAVQDECLGSVRKSFDFRDDETLYVSNHLPQDTLHSSHHLRSKLDVT
ncbi:MAG: hypothetical protein J07HQX50_02353 [Haloquadratum sp. J07HQX50]|nr:MAG: hypothetical protein J07HQX50_02353 [Haloquadratum sp. J07HQX50]